MLLMVIHGWTLVKMALVLGTNCGFVTVAPIGDPGIFHNPVDNRAIAFKITSPAGEGNILTSMGWLCANTSQAANFQIGIYSHDSEADEPLNLLASSGDIAKGTTAGWKTTSVNYALEPSTIYWIALQLDNTSTATNCDFEFSAGEKQDRDFGVTSLLNPWGGSDATGQNLYAFYALYEGAPSITNPKVKVSGTFSTKTIKTKISGTFTEKPLLVKVGGTFQ